MPLDKQIVPLPFAKGIDTKTHEWVVPADRLTELENGTFTKLGAITPRNGFTGLTQNDSSGSLVSPIAVGTRRNELVAMDGRGLYSYAEPTQVWIKKGTLVPCLTESERVIANTYDQQNPSVCALGTLALFAWEDSRGGVRYTLRDVENDTDLASDVLLDAGTDALRPVCVAFDNKLTVSWWKSGSIRTAIVNPGTPRDPTVLTFVDDADASVPIFDVAAADTHLFIAYKRTSNAVNLVVVDTTFAATKFSSVTTFFLGKQLSAVRLNTGRILLGVLQDRMWLYCFNSSGFQEFVQELAPTTTDFANLGVGYDEGLGVGYAVWQDGTAAYSRQFTSSSFSTGGFPVAQRLARSIDVVSRPFISSGSAFCAVVHDSPLQPSVFIVDLESRAVVGSALSTEAGPAPVGSGSRPSPIADTGNGLLFASGQKGQLTFDESVQFAATGIACVTVDTTVTPRAIDVNGGLHVAAGQPWLYDGANVTEHGFLLWPESPTYLVLPGGNISAGTYTYAFTYEWTDNLGNIHRSPSSVYQNVVVASDGSQVVWSVPTLRLTSKPSVRIVGYRNVGAEATGGDTTLQRFTSVTTPTLNDTSVDVVAIVDDNSNDDISTNDVIYNAAGVLDNDPIHNVRQLVAHKSRVFALSNDGNLYFSKLIGNGEPVEFSTLFALQVPSDGGQLTSAASLDDNLIAFRENASYIVTGGGPTDANTGNDYSTGKLTSDVGCVDPDSIVVVPDGAMFKSRKGIYTMQRGQTVQYTGAAVEGFNDLDIRGVVLISDKNQVRFLTDGPMLVYDYFADQWSTFTNLPGLGSTIWKDRHAFIRTLDDRVLVEDSAASDDAGVPYSLKLTTAWVQPAGFQTLMRLYKLVLLGRYLEDNTATISISYDFNPAFLEQHQASGTTVWAGNVFGSQSPFGEGSPFGGGWDLEQLEVRPTRQKCQSFRVKVEVEPAVGCELLGLAATAASKNRTNALPSTKRV